MWTAIGTLAGALVAALGVIKTIADLNVPQGHKAILTRLGRPVPDRRKHPETRPDNVYIEQQGCKGYYRIYGAGFVKRIPFIYRARTMHAWERPIYTDQIEVKFKNGMQYAFKLFANINIPDRGLFASLFVWDDFDGQIKAPMQAELIAYVRDMSAPPKPEEMAEAIRQNLIHCLANQPGMEVEVVRLRLVEFGEVPISLWTEQEGARLELRYAMAKELMARHPGDHSLIMAALHGPSSATGPGLPWTAIPDIPQSELFGGNGVSAA